MKYTRGGKNNERKCSVSEAHRDKFERCVQTDEIMFTMGMEDFDEYRLEIRVTHVFSIAFYHFYQLSS